MFDDTLHARRVLPDDVLQLANVVALQGVLQTRAPPPPFSDCAGGFFRESAHLEMYVDLHLRVRIPRPRPAYMEAVRVFVVRRHPLSNRRVSDQLESAIDARRAAGGPQ